MVVFSVLSLIVSVSICALSATMLSSSSLIFSESVLACSFSFFIVFVFSSVFSYLNQKFFVFNTRGNYVKEYLKCCSTWFVSYLLNVLILELLVKFCIKNVLVSQFISLLTVSIVTYVLFKYFAFSKK